MARKKSEFLGAFGVAMEIFKAIADAVLRAGGGDEELRRIKEEGSPLPGEIAALIMGSKYPTWVVVVDLEEWKAIMLYIDEVEGNRGMLGGSEWYASLDPLYGVKIYNDGTGPLHSNAYNDSMLFPDSNRFRVNIFSAERDAKSWSDHLVQGKLPEC